MDLQRKIRELQQDRDMRGPPPHMPFAPAAMENPGVPCASGPVRAPPNVMPCHSKARQVQSRRLDGESEAARAKVHGATEPSDLYRDPNVRLPTAHLKPDEPTKL